MIKPAILIALGGLVVGLAIALNFAIQDDDDPAVAGRTPTQDGTNSSAPRSPNDGSTQSTAPSFDVVRINPAGDAVIAGRAAPGSVVAIFVDGKIIGEARADGRGEWVFVPTTPLAPGSHELSLIATGRDGVARKSVSNVILVVPEKGKDIAGQPNPDATSPLVLKVPREGRGPSEVLQQPVAKAPPPPDSQPTTATPAAKQVLTVEAIDYDDRGILDISGRAHPGSLIHLYLNNKFLGRVESGARNLWRASPKEAAPQGIHKLRADQIDEGGKVLSRVEVVFARAVPLKDIPPGTLVVVEQGNSLWRIARRTYGSGFRYTVIYQANKRQIDNENLIFPGQVFSLPSLN